MFFFRNPMAIESGSSVGPYLVLSSLGAHTQTLDYVYAEALLKAL